MNRRKMKKRQIWYDNVQKMAIDWILVETYRLIDEDFFICKHLQLVKLVTVKLLRFNGAAHDKKNTIVNCYATIVKS